MSNFRFIGRYHLRAVLVQIIGLLISVFYFIIIFINHDTDNFTKAMTILLAIFGFQSIITIKKFSSKLQIDFNSQGVLLRGNLIKRSSKIRYIRRLSNKKIELYFNALYIITIVDEAEYLDSFFYELSKTSLSYLRTKYQIYNVTNEH